MATSDVHPSGRRPQGRQRSVTRVALSALAPALVAGLTFGTGVAPAATAAPPNCTMTGAVTTCSFAYTGGAQTWVVPDGVLEATFTVVGAAGGAVGNRPGGQGGGVTTTLDLTAGAEYRLYVGGRGGSDASGPGQGLGGWNGGGNGAGALNPGGGGGGGASDVRVAPYSASSRLLVGGGGGGAGSAITFVNAPKGLPGAGGNGGDTGDGSQGSNVTGAWVGAGGGGGGTATAPGVRGGPSSPTQFLYDGCGFWKPAYPTPGEPGVNGTGGAGGHLQTLGGSRCDQYRGWGGGGGGGWYGGGGGGGGITGGAGGGGGSGHAPAGSTKTAPGQLGAHGLITISYQGGWTPVPGGGPMASAPTSAARPGSAGQPQVDDLFYLNAAGNVMQRVVTNGVPSPEYNLGGQLKADSTVGAAWRPGGQRLDLFGRDPGDRLVQLTFTWATGWGAWQVVPGAALLASAPAAASTGPGRVDVFSRGLDGVLQWDALVDGQPLYERSINGTSGMTTAPAASALPNGDITVFYGISLLGRDSRLGEVRRDAAGQWWNEGGLKGAWDRQVRSTPAVARGGTYTQLAYRTDGAGLTWTSVDDDHNWSLGWHDTTAPSPPGSAPALTARPGGGFLVYARGNNNLLTVLVTGGP